MSVGNVDQVLNAHSLSSVDRNNDDIDCENDLVDECNVLDVTNADRDGDLMVAL